MKDDTLYNIQRFNYDQLLQEHVKLQEENEAFRNAAQEICDRFVHPDLYPQAKALLDKIYHD